MFFEEFAQQFCNMITEPQKIAEFMEMIKILNGQKEPIPLPDPPGLQVQFFLHFS